jgi:hypothetical protein|tara:strand:- start:778 stop:1095 length:318 start_codon:yes stop_codon:yes gene_type:complete
MSTEELKRAFVLLLRQDARRLKDMCINNIDLFGNVSEGFSKIDRILDFIREHEDHDIKKSKELQEFVAKSKIRLNNIRKKMVDGVNKKRGEKKEMRDTKRLQRWK